MPRVKGATNAIKRRRNILSRVKGFRFGRKNKEKLANEAIAHAGRNAFRDRRTKKRTFRRLWTTKINATLNEKGLSYSKFIGSLKKNNVEIDRKILAEIAENEPAVFDKIVEEVK
ncbi:50S ribosomal protein L20 [Candidatus Parcubacteria bacterium]|nr:50S ribosomal protein L20 [Candidatus Parcubacteria bacterium]